MYLLKHAKRAELTCIIQITMDQHRLLISSTGVKWGCPFALCCLASRQMLSVLVCRPWLRQMTLLWQTMLCLWLSCGTNLLVNSQRLASFAHY